MFFYEINFIAAVFRSLSLSILEDAGMNTKEIY